MIKPTEKKETFYCSSFWERKKLRYHLAVCTALITLAAIPSSVGPSVPTPGTVWLQNDFRPVDGGCEGDLALRYTLLPNDYERNFTMRANSDCSVTLALLRSEEGVFVPGKMTIVGARAVAANPAGSNQRVFQQWFVGNYVYSPSGCPHLVARHAGSTWDEHPSPEWSEQAWVDGTCIIVRHSATLSGSPFGSMVAHKNGGAECEFIGMFVPFSTVHLDCQVVRTTLNVPSPAQGIEDIVGVGERGQETVFVLSGT